MFYFDYFRCKMRMEIANNLVEIILKIYKADTWIESNWRFLFCVCVRVCIDQYLLAESD